MAPGSDNPSSTAPPSTSLQGGGISQDVIGDEALRTAENEIKHSGCALTFSYIEEDREFGWVSTIPIQQLTPPILTQNV